MRRWLAVVMLAAGGGAAAFAASGREIPVTGDAAVVRRVSHACASQETTTSLMQMLLVGDLEAYKKAVLLRAAQGECIVFSVGEKVFVADVAFWSGLAKVRKKGEIDELWMVHEAIEKAP